MKSPLLRILVACLIATYVRYGVCSKYVDLVKTEVLVFNKDELTDASDGKPRVDKLQCLSPDWMCRESQVTTIACTNQGTTDDGRVLWRCENNYRGRPVVFTNITCEKLHVNSTSTTAITNSTYVFKNSCYIQYRLQGDRHITGRNNTNDDPITVFLVVIALFVAVVLLTSLLCPKRGEEEEIDDDDDEESGLYGIIRRRRRYRRRRTYGGDRSGTFSNCDWFFLGYFCRGGGADCGNCTAAALQAGTSVTFTTT